MTLDFRHFHPTNYQTDKWTDIVRCEVAIATEKPENRNWNSYQTKSGIQKELENRLPFDNEQYIISF